MLKAIKNLFNINSKKTYKELSSCTLIGTITFKKSDADLNIKAYKQYTICRHNNGLYTFENDLMENVVISKGSLRFNKNYQDIIYSYNIDNEELVDVDNQIYFYNLGLQ